MPQLCKCLDASVNVTGAEIGQDFFYIRRLRSDGLRFVKFVFIDPIAGIRVGVAVLKLRGPRLRPRDVFASDQNVGVEELVGVFGDMLFLTLRRRCRYQSWL